MLFAAKFYLIVTLVIVVYTVSVQSGLSCPNCDLYAKCIPLIGGDESDGDPYSCKCMKGYVGNGLKGNCMTKAEMKAKEESSGDPCADPSKNDCDPDANCNPSIREEGKWVCECKEGFVGKGTKGTCNESGGKKLILKKLHNPSGKGNKCDSNANCIVEKNDDLSEGDPLYICECKDGYVGNGEKGNCERSIKV